MQSLNYYPHVGIATVLVVLFLGLTSCQKDCAYPTANDIEELIVDVLRSDDSSPTPTVTITNFHPVCLAYSEQRNRYRFFSVLAEYTCTGYTQCPSGTAVEQFESECDGSTRTWGGLYNSFEYIRRENPSATWSTDTREDCSLCTSAAFALIGLELTSTPDDETHCIGELMLSFYSVSPLEKAMLLIHFAICIYMPECFGSEYSIIRCIQLTEDVAMPQA